MTAPALVVGLPGSSAERFAPRLRDCLRSLKDQRIREVDLLEAPVATLPEDANLAVFLDDAPLEKGRRQAGSEQVLAGLLRLRMRGVPIAVLPNRRSANRWLGNIDGAAPAVEGSLARVFLTGGPGEEMQTLAAAASEGAGLPLVLPDGEALVAIESGWGPRYEAAARGDRWALWTASWHAVDAILTRADVVLHAAGPVAPVEPPVGRLRVLLNPWMRRYPGVEAALLARELAARAHLAPVFHLRSADEVAAVAAALRENPRPG